MRVRGTGRGAILVEVALVLPIAVMLVAGLTHFSLSILRSRVAHRIGFFAAREAGRVCRIRNGEHPCVSVPPRVGQAACLGRSLAELLLSDARIRSLLRAGEWGAAARVVGPPQARHVIVDVQHERGSSCVFCLGSLTPRLYSLTDVSVRFPIIGVDPATGQCREAPNDEAP